MVVDPVDEALLESFPASDPPSWWAGHAIDGSVAFHVDASRGLAAGTVIDLQAPPPMPADVPALDAEWVGGLTAHGLRCVPSPRLDGETCSEWFFELVRRAEFPRLRSRFQSVFAMAGLGDARAFRHAVWGNLEVPIVRVRGVVAHRANMNLVGWTAPAVATLARAREYWRGDQGIAAPLWEVLMAPPVEVLGRVDEAEVARTPACAGVACRPPRSINESSGLSAG